MKRGSASVAEFLFILRSSIKRICVGSPSLFLCYLFAGLLMVNMTATVKKMCSLLLMLYGCNLREIHTLKTFTLGISEFSAASEGSVALWHDGH